MAGPASGLLVNGNESLLTLEGFPALTEVDELWIFNNPALTSAVGFPVLSSIHKDLSLTYNPELTEFAFPSLVSVGQDLVITDNYSLCSDDADTLAESVTVGRRVSILRNYGECL